MLPAVIIMDLDSRIIERRETMGGMRLKTNKTRRVAISNTIGLYILNLLINCQLFILL